MIKDGCPLIMVSNPFIAPHNNPVSKQAATAANTGYFSSNMTVVIAESTRMEPTDMSMRPEIMTNVIPAEMRRFAVSWRKILDRLETEKNRGVRSVTAITRVKKRIRL